MSFDNLPVELCDEILTVAAWDASEGDKPLLCSLALTSWRSLDIVLPALYGTVCITDANFERIVAAVPAGHFSLTRQLWLELSADNAPRARDILHSFSNVEHLASSLQIIGDAAQRIHRLTHFTNIFETFALHLSSSTPRMHGITHLRLMVDSLHLDPLRGDAPNAALQRVVLQSSTLGWDRARLCARILPFFLAGAGVQRVTVCAAPDDANVTALSAALEDLARARHEHRLWIIDTPTDGDLLSQFRPGDTFDDTPWDAGRPVVTEHAP